MPRARDPLLVTSRVLSDVVDSCANTLPVTIAYNNKAVVNGVVFRPSAVLNPPRIQIGGADFRSFYTLVMVDPDAPTPSNPTKKEYLHWLVTDIPETTNVSFGNEIISYENPQPTSGIHRIIFVLFRQPRRPLVLNSQIRVRENFNTKEFAESHNLGSPTAVVYFNCQRERGTGGRRFM